MKKQKHILSLISLLLVTVAMFTSCNTQKSDNKKAVQNASNSTGSSQSPAEDVVFSALPLGAVSAEGWLKNQLVLLAENIASDFETLSPDCKSNGDERSGWLGGNGEDWERGPYYVRGLVSLAYALNDDKLIQQAQKWIDWTIESQTETGAFGPYANDIENFDYWSVMPMLMALEDYYDATNDERVIPFLQNYFDFQKQNLATKPLEEWAKYRGGDNILAVWWLYDKTGDEALKELCMLLYQQTYNWQSVYRDGWAATYHIVNVHQSFKLFPTMYALTGNESYLKTYYEGVENLYMMSGRQDGMSNGDESTRGVSATYGTETCAVVERMLSDEIALCFTHDASIADNLENIAYNALPQQLLPDGKGLTYYTMQNQISACVGSHGFTTDGNDRLAYGAISGFPCCVHNYLMGWPQFVSSMWMKTNDNGLAVGAYGPNTVSAVVGDSTNITIHQETNYPYEDNITLTVTSDKADTYPIYVRIPKWCDKATVSINGEAIENTPAGEYIRLERKWESGDVIELVFPMDFEVTYTENNSISVKYGPVLFAIKIEELCKKNNEPFNPYKWGYNDKYVSYNIEAASDWNYALYNFNFEDIASNFEIIRHEINDDMQYKQSDAPLELKAKAIKVDDWTIKRNDVADTVPLSPVSTNESSPEVVTVSLIPYAFTRLRIANIPWTGDSNVVWEKDTYQDSDDTVTVSGVIIPRKENSKTVTAPDSKFVISYNSTEEWYANIYINKKEIKMVKLEKGENTIELDVYSKDYSEHHNIIELKNVSEQAISKDFTVKITTS